MPKSVKTSSIMSRIYKRNQTGNSSKAPIKKSASNKKPRWKFYITLVFWMIPLLLSGYIFFFQKDKIDEITPDKANNNTTEKHHVLDELIQEEQNHQSSSPQKNMTQTANQSKETPDYESILSKEKTAKIYFVTIDQKKMQAYLKSVQRKIMAGESPVESLISLLLTGPSRWEQNKGLQNVIPVGTKLLKYGCTNGVLVLDFNGNFQINPYGYPGVQLQVSQIVKTMTEFPGIKSVLFRINGKKLDYIDNEGYMPNQEFNSKNIQEKVNL